MSTTKNALLALMALGAVPALADGLSYNYLEARYAESEIEFDFGPDINADGFLLGGSFEFAETVHLFVDYQTFEFDDAIETNMLVFGAGISSPIGANTDVVLRAGIVSAEFQTPFFTDDDDGYQFSIGLRSLLNESIEFYGNAAFSDLEFSGSQTSYTAGLDFYMGDTLAIGPAVTKTDETNTWSLGVKLYF